MPRGPSKEDNVIEAAVEWVERISSHPNNWADQADFYLIHAVESLTGKTFSWESE